MITHETAATDTSTAPTLGRILRRAIADAVLRARRLARDEFAPLASPSAFSWRVVAVYLPLAAVSQWTVDAGYADASLLAWAPPTLASMVVFLAVFAVLRRWATRRTRTPAAVVFAFAVAGTARCLSVGVVAMALGLSDSMEWAFRVAGGVLLSPALLGVMASAVSRHDAHLAMVTELQGRRDRLLGLGQSMDQALARTEDEIRMAVRAAIQPALVALDDVLDRVSTDTSSQKAVTALSRLVDDEVRPISHRLATQDRWAPASLDPARHPGRVRVPLPSRVAIADGMRPVIAASLFFSVAGPTLFRFAAPHVALVQLTEGALLSWFVLAMVKVLVRPVHMSAAWAVATVAGAHALGVMVVVPLIADSWLPVGAGGRMAGLAVAAVVGATTTIAVVVDARRDATQRELVRVVAELNTVVEILGRRARLASTRLAHVLHGSLQGALHAAAIRLAESDRPDPALVQIIRDDIASALARIDQRADGAAGGALQHTVDELVAVWSGHRTVVVTIAPDVSGALTHDRDADAAAAEVVREAVNNALRHGRATTVDVDVQLDEHDLVHIMVIDDGSGWSNDAPRGLGSILFDDLCTSWHHRDLRAETSAEPCSGTQFEAWIGVRSATEIPPSTDRSESH